MKVHEGISHASILLSGARAPTVNAPSGAVVHLTAYGRNEAGAGKRAILTIGGSVARVAQLLEGIREISRVRAGHAHRHARAGVGESEANGVQPLAGEPQTLRLGGVGAVEGIAHARVTDGGHVHADLVSAPAVQVYLGELRAAMSSSVS